MAAFDVSVIDSEAPRRGVFATAVGDGDEFAPAVVDIPVDRFSAQIRTKPGRLRYVTDGTSRTVMLCEQAGKPQAFATRYQKTEGSQSEGAWGTCDYSSFFGGGVNTNNYSEPYGFHTGAMAIMCDGSVHLLPEATAPEILTALLSCRGGEIYSAADW